MVRLIVPDSHGSMIDWKAAKAMLADASRLNPKEVVLLGDHLDVGGVFSNHPANYIKELDYSFDEDIEETEKFLDLLQDAAPGASIYYLEGNHEGHIERWIARNIQHRRDAKRILDSLSPEVALGLKARGIRYFSGSDMHHGLSIPGTIKLGKCLFTHGWCAGQHATATHLNRANYNIVHGHTHRAAGIVTKTALHEAIGAWCPGTLAKLQPLYLHGNPSGWTHGYGVQFVAPSGLFQHVNVTIAGGKSMLRSMIP